MRRTTAVARMLVVALSVAALAGCAGGASDGRGTVSPRTGLAREPRRLTMSWSTAVGSAGGLAADRAGSVVAVDNDSVVALDRQGDEQWSTPVAGAGLGWPALGAGLVVVPTYPDEGRGGCVGLDRSNGARLWAYEERDTQGVAVARAGERVVCAFASGVVVAVDRHTGARLWRRVLVPDAPRSAVSISEQTALAVDNETGELAFAVRVDSNSYIETLDLASGAERGAFDATEVAPTSAPVGTGPGLIAVGFSRSREVCVLELLHKRVQRCVKVPAPDGFDPAGIPVVADGLVLVTGRDGSLTAVDFPARKVRWSVRVPDPILGARPTVVNGVVMFNDWSRVPWAVHLADGSAVAVPKFDGWVTATAADADGGFEVAKRNLDGGWIERWAPA